MQAFQTAEEESGTPVASTGKGIGAAAGTSSAVAVTGSSVASASQEKTTGAAGSSSSIVKPVAVAGRTRQATCRNCAGVAVTIGVATKPVAKRTVTAVPERGTSA